MKQSEGPLLAQFTGWKTVFMRESRTGGETILSSFEDKMMANADLYSGASLHPWNRKAWNQRWIVRVCEQTPFVAGRWLPTWTEYIRECGTKLCNGWHNYFAALVVESQSSGDFTRESAIKLYRYHYNFSAAFAVD